MRRRFWTLVLFVAAVSVLLTFTLRLPRTVAAQQNATAQKEGPVQQHNKAILQQEDAKTQASLYPKDKPRDFTQAAAAFRLNSRRMIDKKWDDDFMGPYDMVLDWYKPVFESHKAGFELQTHSVFAEGPNRILIAHSGDAKIPAGREGPSTPTRPPSKPGVLAVNQNGEVSENWTQWGDLFVFPHTVTECPFDADKSVWVVDREGAALYKFSNDGKKLLMTIGEKSKPGYDNTHFNYPSDLTCTPDGSIIVADGYVNSRVLKFDKNGKFLAQVGAQNPGDQPGRFNLIHSVAVDKQGRVYVADRGNHRVQIFDQNLKYLSEIGVHTPCQLEISQDGYLWVSSCMLSRILKFDLNGKLLYSFGSPMTVGEGGWGNTHSSSIGPDGVFYVLDESQHAVNRLVPRPNADKSHLIAPAYTQ